MYSPRLSWFLLLTALVLLASACPDDQYCKDCIYVEDDKFQCLSCQNAYFNAKSRTCYAIDQPIPNCVTYNGDYPHKCIECEFGYYPQADGSCKECPMRCRICSESECLGCAERLIPISGNCADSKQKCTDENCSICNKYDRCMLCENGYSINGTAACVRSIQYCAEIGEQSRCQRCWTGFYLDEDLQCVQIKKYSIAWYIFAGVMLVLLLAAGWVFLKKEHRNRTFTEDSYANLN